MTAQVILGDCLEVMLGMATGSAQTCVTSPPYFGLRDYGQDGQIGLEETPAEYVQRLVEVFREVRRVLADDGTLWLNIGDSYAGGGGFSASAPSNQAGGSGMAGSRERLHSALKPGGVKPQGDVKQKDLIGIPWMLAFALRADGWYLRQDIVWHKPNPMPESVTDRCTKAHEYVFLLSKGQRYYINPEGMKEPAAWGARGSEFHTGKTGEHQLGRASSKPRPAGNKTHKYVQEYSSSGTGEHRTKEGLLKIADVPWETRNRRSVWTISTKPFSEAHFATMPVELAETCILAGSRLGDTVLDPFMGAFTTAVAALKHGRHAIGAELSPEYIKIGERRIRPLLGQPLLLGVS